MFCNCFASVKGAEKIFLEVLFFGGFIMFDPKVVTTSNVAPSCASCSICALCLADGPIPDFEGAGLAGLFGLCAR